MGTCAGLGRLVAAAVALVLASPAAAAAEPASRDRSLPPPAGFVNDYAGVLPAAERERLEASLRALERETGAELAVAVVPRAAPLTPKEYAVRLFEAWGIGKEGRDDGVLLLVALEERRVEVEVGYGLEGVLPDGLVGQVLDRHVIPRFREGDLPRGIADGAAALAERIREAARTEGGGAPGGAGPGNGSGTAPRTRAGGAPAVPPLFVGAIALVVLLLAAEVMVLRRRARRCPICGGRLAADREVLRQATPVAPGEGLRTVWCTRCDYRKEEVYSIPWFDPGPSGGGFRRGGFGGFGGGRGGFGGFGGGRSGGGGAGRSW